MKTLINLASNSISTLVNAANGKPLNAVLVVFVFHIALDHFLSKVEILIFGSTFSHVLDAVLAALFICYALFVVWACCVYQKKKDINEARLRRTSMRTPG